MITIAEYAKSRNISQTAVRRQLSRYTEELEGHITIQNRTKFLDSDAVDFLDQHRMLRTVIQENAEGKAKEEINRLKAEISLLQAEKVKDQQKIISLLEENKNLIQYQAENRLLLEQKDRDQAELMEVRKKLQETEQEVNSFLPSWFGFYRKK